MSVHMRNHESTERTVDINQEESLVKALTSPEESITVPETGVTDSCRSLFGCWELNPVLLQEQKVLLPVEPSLQPQPLLDFKHIGCNLKNINFSTMSTSCV